MVSTVLWILLLLALVGVPAVAGVLRRNARRPDWLPLAGAAVIGIGFGVVTMTGYDAGVSTGDAVKGVALAVALGAAPAYGLFALGRALAERPVVLGIACVAVTVPLAVVYFIGAILVAGLVHCPPDAYECPF
jgi:hypothetical protein